jgi:hypothetical protein
VRPVRGVVEHRETMRDCQAATISATNTFLMRTRQTPETEPKSFEELVPLNSENDRELTRRERSTTVSINEGLMRLGRLSH